METTLLDGIEIETGPNPQYAIIWMHGLGADGNDFAPIVPELGLQDGPAVRFIFPHAPVRPVTINNGMAMRAWYDILNGADLARQEDEPGLRNSQQHIEQLIARENERGIPADKIILAGFSQGCAMTLQTGLRQDKKLAGMVCLSGYLPIASLIDAERHTANQDTPIFMAHGLHDPVVTLPRGEASRRKLQDLGYTVEWRTYPMPHSVCLEEINDLSAFLRKIIV